MSISFIRPAKKKPEGKGKFLPPLQASFLSKCLNLSEPQFPKKKKKEKKKGGVQYYPLHQVVGLNRGGILWKTLRKQSSSRQLLAIIVFQWGELKSFTDLQNESNSHNGKLPERGWSQGLPLPGSFLNVIWGQTHWALALFLLSSTDAAGFTKWPDVIRGN